MPEPISPLREAVACYLRAVELERGASAHTVRAYAGDLETFVAFVEQRRAEPDPALIDLELLREWVWSQSDSGLAASTLARRASTLRGFTAWLARTGRAPADAATRLRAPRPDRHLPRVLSRPQVDALLDGLAARAATHDPQALRDLAMIELLYASALRVSELVGLDLGDVDAARRVVRVLGKGAKERVVPFGVPAARAVAGYLELGRPALLGDRSGPALFLGARGGASRPAPCTRSWPACSPSTPAAGPPARTPSGTPLRRTCSTAGPTCARCRRSSGTRASARRRSTPT